MDSNLRKKAILACSGIILVLILVVCIMNREKLSSSKRKKNTKPNKVTEATEVSQNATGSEAEDGYRDFLDDPFFFDKDEENVTVDETPLKRVTISVKSVYRDIRVIINDADGNKVLGENFSVVVRKQEEEIGTYQDDDGDGTIHVTDMAPGEYSVTLEEREGYRVPIADVKIRVSEVVSYSYISDILNFVSEETTVNTHAEMAGGFAVDSDEKLRSEIIANEGAKLGIRVSSEDGEIDWTKVQALGITYAYIRVGYRGMTTGVLVLDSMFDANIRDALACGLNVGVYIEGQAIEELEAVEEASLCIAKCREYAVSYPIFYCVGTLPQTDARQMRNTILDDVCMTAVCKAFCDTMENAGYRTGIMATSSFLKNNVVMKSLNKYYVYLVDYTEKAKYSGDIVFREYTDEAWVEGLGRGRVAWSVYGQLNQ